MRNLLTHVREVVWSPGYGVSVTVGAAVSAGLVFLSTLGFVVAIIATVIIPLGVGLLYKVWWERRGWIYEILNFEETWEICDNRGSKVVVTKAMDVTFLRDNVVAFTDPAWGDGDLFAEYSCRPGTCAGVFQIQPMKYAHVVLDPPRLRGDEEHIESTRVVTGGFGKDNEWVQVDSDTCTGPITIKVIFPLDRAPEICTWSRRRRGKEKGLGGVALVNRPDGRQECSVRAGRTSPDDVYRLVWTW